MGPTGRHSQFSHVRKAFLLLERVAVPSEMQLQDLLVVFGQPKGRKFKSEFSSVDY